jgi:ABC-type nickel/cobalt efflux system permease component RcnA
MLTVLAGLVAGGAHALTGPDHLAALLPIAAARGRRAGLTGLLWGAGHGVGVTLVGVLVLAIGATADVQVLSAWSELLVGVTLVVVGTWGLRRGLRTVVHSHAHEHDHEHEHLHVHAPGVDHAAPEAHAGHQHAAFGVGVLHGLAGAGHLVAALPALALGWTWGTAWLIAYLAGAMAAMGAFGAAVGGSAHRLDPTSMRRVVAGAGAIAVAVGVAWIAHGIPAVW